MSFIIEKSDGNQLPRHLCPERAAAQRECQRLQDEFTANAKQSYKPIHPSKQHRKNPISNSKEVKNTITLST